MICGHDTTNKFLKVLYAALDDWENFAPLIFDAHPKMEPLDIPKGIYQCGKCGDIKHLYLGEISLGWVCDRCNEQEMKPIIKVDMIVQGVTVLFREG